MPRPEPPLTPVASTDIQGQEKSHNPQDLNFSLPPPALHSQGGSSASSNDSIKSDSSYHPSNHPKSPARPTSSRKRARPSMAQLDTDAASLPSQFSLPPPPTRSRKIIQMKPGATEKKGAAAAGSAEKRKSSLAGKAPASSTAGKKTARKTAHSVIERRRRSKMNEEFDTMKEMIPACQGETMHKLAILQAGIEYLRYLEQCVSDLKVANRSFPASTPRHSQSQAPTPRPRSPASSQSDDEPEDDDVSDDAEDSDEEMEEAEPQSIISSSFTFVASAYSSTQPSPGVAPCHQSSYSRSSTTSSLPSPAFGPMRSDFIHSVESSPALLPNASRDADHEATAALLMLNSDRRGSQTQNRRGTGGLSVQDLLST